MCRIAFSYDVNLPKKSISFLAEYLSINRFVLYFTLHIICITNNIFFYVLKNEIDVVSLFF